MLKRHTNPTTNDMGTSESKTRGYVQPGKFSVRRMEPEDFFRVREILVLFFPKIEFEEPTLFDFFFSDSEKTYSIVAESAGNIIATSTLKIGQAKDVYVDGPLYTYSDAQIRYVAKDPRSSIRGLGKTLVGELLNFASRCPEIKSCALLVKPRNAQAIHVYESLGFVPTQTIVMDLNTGAPLMCMVRKIETQQIDLERGGSR